MKRRSERVISFLGSPTLTVWMVGLFVVFYLTLSIWIGEAFGRYVQLLSSSTVFRAFYLLFLLNVVLRVVALTRSGRSGWSALMLRLPLLVGVVLVLATFFLSLNFRELRSSPPLGAGDPLELPWMRERYRIIKVEPAIDKRALRTDDSVVFDYEPGITIAGPDGKQREIGAFPPRKVENGFMHVLTFGIGPGVELRKGNKVVWKGYMALRLVPFGTIDTFTIPDHSYQFYLSVVPNGTVRRGRETARTYDLERPRYLVEIVKGDRVLAKKETEDSVVFDGDMALSFFMPSDWVLIEAVWDPFLPWFAFSLLVLAAGILLFPLSYLFLRRPGTTGGTTS